ncbi:MAG: aspartate kinase [Oscillospiraceae bacterium]|nr:aspartate kinase [Oscillospiraceae bacterium]
MQPIVVKFGGSSLASAAQIEKAAAIIRQNPNRRYVVASAPGKRNAADTKVTDLLYRCCDAALAGEDFSPVLAEIHGRFSSIAKDLAVSFPVDEELSEIETHLRNHPQRDYMASRGEYLNSKLIAAYLDIPFVDPADSVLFREDGTFDSETTNARLAAALRDLPRAVIAGFYGALPDGTVHTFSRGGSDITGSLVARAVNASLYENWTDVSGMLVTDPRIVPNPKAIDYITYTELRELSYMGASVLHEDAVFPVRAAGIPINIRNTNHPDDAGTMIAPHLPPEADGKIVTGIAGRKGFTNIQIEKAMMNAEIGLGACVLQVLSSFGVPFEHLPSGIDTLSVVVTTSLLAPVREQVLEALQREVRPDSISIEDHLSLVAVVGHGMVRTKGIAARVFQAIAVADVNIRMIDQGSSELNIIIGVSDDDYEAVIRSLYRAFEALL